MNYERLLAAAIIAVKRNQQLCKYLLDVVLGTWGTDELNTYLVEIQVVSRCIYLGMAQHTYQNSSKYLYCCLLYLLNQQSISSSATYVSGSCFLYLSQFLSLSPNFSLSLFGSVCVGVGLLSEFDKVLVFIVF